MGMRVGSATYAEVRTSNARRSSSSGLHDKFRSAVLGMMTAHKRGYIAAQASRGPTVTRPVVVLLFEDPFWVEGPLALSCRKHNGHLPDSRRRAISCLFRCMNSRSDVSENAIYSIQRSLAISRPQMPMSSSKDMPFKIYWCCTVLDSLPAPYRGPQKGSSCTYGL